MSLHDEYLKLRVELHKVETELSDRTPDGMFRIEVIPDGIKLETRTPSGTNDIVHNLYLNREQALFLMAYIAKVFNA